MGGLLREALLREKIFLISLPPPTQPTFHLFSFIPQLFSSLPLFHASYHFFFLSLTIPSCHMQMKDTAVDLMLINTVQIFILGDDFMAREGPDLLEMQGTQCFNLIIVTHTVQHSHHHIFKKKKKMPQQTNRQRNRQ